MTPAAPTPVKIGFPACRFPGVCGFPAVARGNLSTALCTIHAATHNAGRSSSARNTFDKAPSVTSAVARAISGAR